jgi:Zn-dependent M28 family amino/carboxypeptidase
MKLSASISIFPFLLIFVLFFTSCTKEEKLTEKEALIYQITDDIKADSIESYVIWMQEMGTRFALADNRRNVAVSIKNRFIRMGYNDTKLDSFSITKTYRGVTYNQTQYNVIATLEGSTPNDSICIIGGHYDNITGTGDPFTVAPGANDNASGVAAAIEVARVFKENSFIPATTIKFIAFGSEEQGLYGSKAYALNASQTLVKIRFMLNNDMIAYQPGNDKTNWQINIIDYNNSHSFRYQAEGLCRKYTVLKPYNDNTYSNASDSYPFYNYGYKALFFFSRVMDPNYHTINDVAANCNFEYCSEIVKLNCAILVDRN